MNPKHNCLYVLNYSFFDGGRQQQQQQQQAKWIDPSQIFFALLCSAAYSFIFRYYHLSAAAADLQVSYGACCLWVHNC